MRGKPIEVPELDPELASDLFDRTEPLDLDALAGEVASELVARRGDRIAHIAAVHHVTEQAVRDGLRAEVREMLAIVTQRHLITVVIRDASKEIH